MNRREPHHFTVENLKYSIILLFFIYPVDLAMAGEYQTGRNLNRKTYTTQKAIHNKPHIDGILDDKCWDLVEWQGGFVQWEPYEGQDPSQETYFKVLYDDDNIYFGIFAHDTKPGEIVKRMSRRDGFEGDFIEINLDSYFDKRTAFSFTVSASGVKGDELITNDGQNWDMTWDAIWYAKTIITDSGWYAEVQIPFSQLRFARQHEYTWGMQVKRRLFRKEERSVWQFIPKDASGWVSKFGELKGISNIKPQRRIDLFPYVLGSTERYQEEEGNPFATGKDSYFSAGLDGKIGLTNDLTLDLTINPDFGQVEADPSEVNLTAYETFFQERRPFFIEGNNILNFQITGGDGGFSRDNLFYSRRIGRVPHYYPDVDDDTYVDVPGNTTILGAAKVTGKTKNGTSIGILEGLTQKEYASIDDEGDRYKIAVEPLTNYFIARVQQDLDSGNTIVGGMFTATNRDITDEQFLDLPLNAYSGGLDIEQYWKSKTYQLVASFAYSYISGDTLAMINAQESPARYFQRPDADYITLDSGRTSLQGHSGNLQIGKISQGHWRYMAFLTWRSPGFETNDIGYLRAADAVMEAVWVAYRIWEPFSIFRNFNINANQWHGWNFGGESTFSGGNVNLNADFKNHWRLGTGFNLNGPSLSKSELRGGPSLAEPGGWSNWFNMGTDNRRKIKFNIGGHIYKGRYEHSNETSFWGGINIRPHDAFYIRFAPFASLSKRRLQYVETLNFEGDDRYVMASIDQSTFGISVRFDVNITPDLTIQYYGQPFMSTGSYFDLKHIISPRDEVYENRFHQFTEEEISYNPEEEIYNVDENLDGETDYSFGNPDFKYFDYNSNLVIRWEYIPGSVLYLVWSQNRNDSHTAKDFSISNGMKEIFSIVPHNVFLIKLSYRLKI